MKTHKQAIRVSSFNRLSNKLYKYVLIVAALCLFATKSLSAFETSKENLVSVKWLKENLNNPEILLIDASPTQRYEAKHIRGAVNVDYFSYGLGKMTNSEVEKFYQSKGISPGKTLVIYDEGGTMFATRLFFSLYYSGFPVKNLLILDGGLSKWEEEGLDVTKDIPSVTEIGTFTIKKLNKTIKAELPEFLMASGDLEKNVLLEALDSEWHFGQTLAYGKPGHVPNAIMMPRTDFYNPDKTFKLPEEIKKMLNYYGINPGQKIYTYCGGGVAATVPFFALKFLLDYPEVKLFEESLHGWLSDERDLPAWTYDAPFIMREIEWLQSWNGEMLRMYKGPTVSVIDIRPAEAYNKGHIPFSLNIPVELFKNHLNTPEKLTEQLGPAGVDVSHEAVIVSGKGITSEAALVFVLLEKLGQKKVSIYTNTLEKWEKAGNKLPKDATTVAPKKHPFDVSIPPTEYPGNFKKDVIISDVNNTKGAFQKVLIASGEKKPSNRQEGEMVHVPCLKLLNADGTPKEAKDIWKLLTEARVPRYAELICVSDDPGEAAINYFILKLMGYPDVKVLMNSKL